MKDNRFILSIALAGVALWIATAALAGEPVIRNGDFESGDLSGWTVFATISGTLGGDSFPNVVDFDIRGDGVATRSARFKVGQQSFKSSVSTPEGGGIFQKVSLGAGQWTLIADIACSFTSDNEKHIRNLAGGFFELILDNAVLDSHDCGPIGKGSTERGRLNGSTKVIGGLHEIRLRITRPFEAPTDGPASFQFIDNVKLTFISIP